MKKVLSSILALTLATHSVAFADCNFSQDIKKMDNGHFEYTSDCHKDVGNTYNALDKKKLQVEELYKALDLKDLALQKADERNNGLREALYKVEDRVNAMEQIKSRNEVLYFIGGVVITGLAIYAAKEITRP